MTYGEITSCRHVRCPTFSSNAGEPDRIQAQGTLTATGMGEVLSDDPALAGAADATRTNVTRPMPALTAGLAGQLVIDADGSGGVSAGDTLAYRLDVSSVGSQSVTGVAVRVPVPSGGEFVAGSASTSPGSLEVDPDLVATIGDLGLDVTATGDDVGA